MIRRRKIKLYKGEFLEILKLISSNQFSTGRYIREFERKFADYVGVKHAIATCRGRTAMMLLLDALNLKKGDEVIFPAYTLKELIALVKKRGFKPVLVDIEKDSFNIDPNLIEEKITEKTKVIVATHMFGLPCNIKRILKIAKKHDVKVIEDCCLAHGAEFEGKKVGSFGVAGFFSFQQIKLINTFEGGMITTNNGEIANFIRKEIDKFPSYESGVFKKILLVYLEDFVLRSPLFYLFSVLFYFRPTKKLFNKMYVSFIKCTSVERSKYTNAQALIGLNRLNNLEKIIEKKRENAELLKKLLDRRIEVQRTNLKCRHSYYYFVIKSNWDSEKVQRRLLLRGIDTSVKNELTDDCTVLAQEFSDKCPVTYSVFNSAMQIPIYESLTKKDIYKIGDALNKELM